MEEELLERLLSEPTLITLVQSRINAGERPQGESLPAISFLEISPGRNYVHSGACTLGNPRIEFNCYGSTTLEAKRVRDALTLVLETRKTQGTVDFSVALLDAERGPIIEDNGGGDKSHRYSSDFIVWFSRAA